MDEDNRENTSEKLFRRRCQSISSLKIVNKVGEEVHTLGECLHRSISRSPKVNHAPSPIPRYLATVRSSRVSSQSEDEDYDSDEEDRRNGVPIIVIETQGSKLTPAMITSVSQEIEEKMERGRQLQKLLGLPRQRYFNARTRYFESRGIDWDAQAWSDFIALEDEYFKIADQIDSLECEVSHLKTKLSNFLDHKQLLPIGRWNIDGDGTRTWLLDNGYGDSKEGS